LFVVGTAAWLIIVHPSKNFDDWSTPLYTGHTDHAAHDTAGHEEAHAESPTDLTTIKGITPKISSTLNAVGIFTYDQLAARKPDELERILSDSGLRVHGKAAAWINQAKSAH